MRTRSRRPGSVLLLSIFFLFLLFFLAMALLQLLPVELNAARWARMNQEASYAADAGITDTMAWLENVLAGNQGELNELTKPSTRTGTFGDWSWSVEVQPDAETRNANPIHVFRLTCVATLNDRPFRRVVADVGQDSFARYLSFIGSSDNQTRINLGRNRQIEGPMHVNGIATIGYDSDWFSSGTPYFHGTYTTSGFYTPPGKTQGFGDGVRYTDTTGSDTDLKPYNDQGSAIPERYNRIFAQGREALKTGVGEKEMPVSNRNLAQEAWGSQVTPGTQGVHINTTLASDDQRGIFIHGDVSRMDLSVVEGNAVMTVKQGPKDAEQRSVVTILSEQGMTIPAGAQVNGVVQGQQQYIDVKNTVIQKPDGPGGQKVFEVAPGLTNGLVYCTGTIQGLQGENKGRRTIAVDVEDKKDIVISGDLTRRDTVVGEKPTGSADTLGLIGNNIRIGSAAKRNQTETLYLYCSMFAGSKNKDGVYEGTVMVDEMDNYGLGYGNFTLFGSMVRAKDSPFLTYTIDGNTGDVDVGGYIPTMRYDATVATNPPPYFPTMPDLKVLSWKEEPYR